MNSPHWRSGCCAQPPQITPSRSGMWEWSRIAAVLFASWNMRNRSTQVNLLKALFECLSRACADLEGGSGGPDPPWNLQSLISPILLKMKKIVIFHICALPQLYVKQNRSYFKLDPSWKKFLNPSLSWMKWKKYILRLYLLISILFWPQMKEMNFFVIQISSLFQRQMKEIYFMSYVFLNFQLILAAPTVVDCSRQIRIIKYECTWLLSGILRKQFSIPTAFSNT